MLKMAGHHLHADEAGTGVSRAELQRLRDYWRVRDGKGVGKSSGRRRKRNKRGRGRPKLPASQKKKPMHFRLSDVERNMLHRMARLANVTPSQWLRNQLEKASASYCHTKKPPA